MSQAPLEKLASLTPLIGLCLLLAACEPTVKVEAPQEPITINLNIKLDADVRLRLEEAAQEDIEANPDIF
jgi:predicted component of type VI protein secretion system